MWLFTKEGFFSVVAHRDDADKVVIRARERSHLENLRRRVLLGAVVSTPEADYPYRITARRTAWEAVAADLAEGIDYPNFKAACKTIDHKKLIKVWEVMQ